jgi:hypothetical protein
MAALLQLKQLILLSIFNEARAHIVKHSSRPQERQGLASLQSGRSHHSLGLQFAHRKMMSDLFHD